ncbi:MAG: ATP-binding protein [Treponema sp.]|nr:ATP-binding protein [Treponema sp.]
MCADFFHDRNLSSSFTITEDIDGTEFETKSFMEKDKDKSTVHLYTDEEKESIKPFKAAALISEVSSGQSKGRVVTEITSGNSIEHNVYGDPKLFARPDILYLDTHRSHSGNIIESFGKIDIQGKSSKVIETLRLLDSSIKDLTVVVSDGMNQFFASLEGHEKKVPVKSMGDGLNRLLEMIVTIIANPGSIILVDEMENGFHYTLHKDLWRVISKAIVLSGSQLFATTHSYECISSAAEAASEDSFADKFAYIRVDREQGGFFPRYYDSGLLLSAVSTEMEVR